MTEQQPEPDAAAYVVEQIHLTIDQLRQSWAWLVDLVEPGHASPGSARAVTDEQAERLEAVGHSDRAYREWNLRYGMSALPPSPAAARLTVLDAQAVVAMCVLDAARATAAAASAVYVGGRPTVAESVRDALAWLDGTSEQPGAVDELRNAKLAAAIDKWLQRADRTARAAARELDEDVEPVGERCPACRRKSLQRELGGAGAVTRCVSESCCCTGGAEPGKPACGCGRSRLEPGRRHVWLPSELGELSTAIEAAFPASPRLARSTWGHGGWQSRNMGGTP